MVVLYRAGRQGVKVRVVIYTSLVVALVALYAGYQLLMTYGTAPGDGGVLAPWWQRAAWGATVSALGLAFAIGMAAYGRLYVYQLALLPDGRVRVTTLSWRGPVSADVDASCLYATKRHAGELRLPNAPTVRAPWVSVRMPGRSWPLIVDMQGEMHDPALLARVLKGERVEIARPAIN